MCYTYDRMNLVLDNSNFSYYLYGNGGQRVAKLTGSSITLGTGFATNALLDNYTLYPSEYLVVTQQGYTKYYYAGGNRIASKIGTGGFGKMQQLCTLEQNLTANANILFDNILQHAVNTTNPPTDEYPVDVCNGYNVATELLTEPLLDFYINSLSLNFTQSNLLQQFRQNLTGGTEAVYYFHSDHLGSASWITNNTGLPVQHLLYLPFGEHFVNEHSSGYDERFTFTGKERDAETGYYYHGARFNSSDIGWLSVDPMADKYPSISPYAYCAWNPVKLVDPDGRDGVKIINKQTRSITVAATYYVTSQPILGLPHTSYSSSEIESMNKNINNILNSQSYTYEIDGETYDVFFDLRFVDARESWEANEAAKKDPIGNTLSVLTEEIAKNLFPITDNGDDTESYVGGVTGNNKNIVMNSRLDNTRRRIHEIFHTLFFSNDDAESGIGNYVPGVDMPNQNDINMLLSNPQLPERVVEIE